MPSPRQARRYIGLGTKARRSGNSAPLGLDVSNLDSPTLLEMRDVEIEDLLATLIELNRPQAVVS